MAVFSYTLPTVGGDEDTWGATLNANWTALGAFLGALDSTELAVLDGITVTTAELNFADGVTSNIQTQLDAKAPLASPALTGTATVVNATVSGTLDVSAGTLTLADNQIAGAKVVGATDTTKGSVRRATDAEAVAGTVASWVMPNVAQTKLMIDTHRGQYLHVRDEKANGTDGGSATSGSYATRVLNTEVSNTISGASLGSNQITLPDGVYWFDASATGFWCGRFRAALYNVTDAAYVTKGHAVDSSDADEGQFAVVKGFLTVSGGPKVYELRSRCSLSNSGDGFGRAASFSENEVYSEVIIEKIG